MKFFKNIDIGRKKSNLVIFVLFKTKLNYNIKLNLPFKIFNGKAHRITNTKSYRHRQKKTTSFTLTIFIVYIKLRAYNTCLTRYLLKTEVLKTTK